MKTLKIIAMIGTAMLPLLGQAEKAKVIFKDCADNYPIKTNYGKAGGIGFSMYNGGNFTVRETLLASGKKTKIISFNSGNYAKFTTIRVVASFEQRYGQLYYRLGESGHIANSVIVIGIQDSEGNSGPWVDIDPAGQVRTWSPKLKGTGVKIKVAKLVDISINYDLKNKSYDVMLGDKIIATKIPFSSNKFTTPSQIVLSVAYWGKPGAGILKAWGVRTGSTAFTAKPSAEFYKGKVMKKGEDGKDDE